MSIRVDRSLLDQSWPQLENFQVSEHIRAGDTLILASGFEERALEVLKKVSASGIERLTVISFEYFPKITENRAADVRDVCCLPDWDLYVVPYHRDNPTGAFEHASVHLNPGGRVFIDVSGMSRLLIVQLIVGILQSGRRDVSILYTTAAEYSPTEAQAREQLQAHSPDVETVLSFTSTGVFGLAVLPELASHNPHQAPIRLIAFPSFNPAQLLSSRSVIQPSNLSLIHGVPDRPEMRWRTEVIARLNQQEDVVDAQQLHASTRDYREALKTLLELYDQWAEFFTLVLAPTGTKMQSVACGLFRAFVDDVQVVYPTPLKFTNPEAHTTGVEAMFILSLDLFVTWRAAAFID